ncbi:MAG: hypothetical protein NZV14_07440 [Bryobacteraceae bacterium]|nr:hypothetical protein [Bryobacteraceae bacterium]MDW8377978.1 hypothetical protein [Bryobacterales bacterium]
MFLGLQHGFRLATQPGTREALKGRYFRDWFNSVGGLGGWDDGDGPLANYVGHSLQGAISGYIWIQNDPFGRRQQFSWTRAYVRSRLRAFAWSTLYSTQYEIGPISDAAIGNVGLRPETKGMVDLVITPTVGMAWLVTEDVLDRHFIQWIERRTGSPWIKLMTRSWLNPGRSMANMLRFRVPWYRDTREGVFRRP